ncbi:unnamed protein product [Dimorphilus gyrociliatus]|uniref:Uncharacterized protein n=1 Tax=Dimorphilus gyrociliatus TaxID=2664684 RepID=A0A7I8W3Q8_9ANNE|nr:unnamed protein product [Dimorphilus gyrociliatus]
MMLRKIARTNWRKNRKQPFNCAYTKAYDPQIYKENKKYIPIRERGYSNISNLIRTKETNPTKDRTLGTVNCPLASTYCVDKLFNKQFKHKQTSPRTKAAKSWENLLKVNQPNRAIALGKPRRESNLYPLVILTCKELNDVTTDRIIKEFQKKTDLEGCLNLNKDNGKITREIAKELLDHLTVIARSSKDKIEHKVPERAIQRKLNKYTQTLLEENAQGDQKPDYFNKMRKRNEKNMREKAKGDDARDVNFIWNSEDELKNCERCGYTCTEICSKEIETYECLSSEHKAGNYVKRHRSHSGISTSSQISSTELNTSADGKIDKLTNQNQRKISSRKRIFKDLLPRKMKYKQSTEHPIYRCNWFPSMEKENRLYSVPFRFNLLKRRMNDAYLSTALRNFIERLKNINPNNNNSNNRGHNHNRNRNHKQQMTLEWLLTPANTCSNNHQRLRSLCKSVRQRRRERCPKNSSFDEVMKSRRWRYSGDEPWNGTIDLLQVPNQLRAVNQKDFIQESEILESIRSLNDLFQYGQNNNNNKVNSSDPQPNSSKDEFSIKPSRSGFVEEIIAPVETKTDYKQDEEILTKVAAQEAKRRLSRCTSTREEEIQPSNYQPTKVKDLIIGPLVDLESVWTQQPNLINKNKSSSISKIHWPKVIDSLDIYKVKSFQKFSQFQNRALSSDEQYEMDSNIKLNELRSPSIKHASNKTTDGNNRIKEVLNRIFDDVKSTLKSPEAYQLEEDGIVRHVMNRLEAKKHYLNNGKQVLDEEEEQSSHLNRENATEEVENSPKVTASFIQNLIDQAEANCMKKRHCRSKCKCYQHQRQLDISPTKIEIIVKQETDGGETIKPRVVDLKPTQPPAIHQLNDTESQNRQFNQNETYLNHQQYLCTNPNHIRFQRPLACRMSNGKKFWRKILNECRKEEKKRRSTGKEEKILDELETIKKQLIHMKIKFMHKRSKKIENWLWDQNNSNINVILTENEQPITTGSMADTLEEERHNNIKEK